MRITNNKLKVGQTSSWTFIERDKHQVGQIPGQTNIEWDKINVGQTLCWTIIERETSKWSKHQVG